MFSPSGILKSLLTNFSRTSVFRNRIQGPPSQREAAAVEKQRSSQMMKFLNKIGLADCLSCNCVRSLEGYRSWHFKKRESVLSFHIVIFVLVQLQQGKTATADEASASVLKTDQRWHSASSYGFGRISSRDCGSEDCTCGANR